MLNKRHCLLAGTAITALAVTVTWASMAIAQDKYPSRPIDIIVPFAPGGSTDLSARTTAAYVSKKWGATFNIINKPGARGIPQTQDLYRAKPDGYTLLAENPTTNTMLAAAMQKELPFDTFERSFLGLNTGTPFTVIVPPASPYKTLGEMLDDAKKNPEKLSYTSQGSTGMPDYFIRVLFQKAGVDVAKAPAIMVTGAAPTITMTAGGNVAMGLSSASGALAGVKSGIIRALVISSKDRDPDFPGVPTTVELGYPVVISWNGLSAPPKTPKPIVEMWEKVLAESAKDPEFHESLKKIGAVPFHYDSAGMKEFIRNEINEAGKLFAAK